MSITTTFFRAYAKGTVLIPKHSKPDVPEEAVAFKFPQPGTTYQEPAQTDTQAEPQIIPFPSPIRYSIDQLRNMDTLDVPRFDSDFQYSVLPGEQIIYRRYSSRGGHVLEGNFVNNVTGAIENIQIKVPTSTLDRFEKASGNVQTPELCPIRQSA